MRVGLFFGSFNPVHRGHLIVAHYALKFCSLDRLWFMVAPQHNLKPLVDESIRLKLVKLSIHDMKTLKGMNNSIKTLLTTESTEKLCPCFLYFRVFRAFRGLRFRF